VSGPGRRSPGAGPAALVLVAATLAGCVGSAPAPIPAATPAVAPVEVTLLAAASLSDVAADLATAYETGRPGVSIRLSIGSTSELRAQIEAGAPADLLAAADVATPAALVAAGLAADEPVVFAANELALIVPAANPAGVTDAYDLGRPGLRIVAAAPEVPISRYVDRLIANLQAYRGAQAELPRIYAENVVSREPNVRAVLARIELGEADAAFVYATDAAGDRDVAVIPLPPGTNVTVEHAAVRLASSANPAAADDLLAWLAGPEAAAILAARGFLPPP
jgi:molybdate transport system substrate-binding protein